jgi:hypothetical protein
LHQLGIAYQHLISIDGGKDRAVIPGKWIVDFKQFCEHQQPIFECPDDLRENKGSSEGLGEVAIVVNPDKPNHRDHFDIPLSGDHPNVRESSWVMTNFPSSVPGAYGLEIEDILGGGDMDYNDLRLLIEPLEDGSMKVTAVSRSAGYSFALRGPDGTLLANPFHPPSSVIVNGVGGQSSYGINNLAGKLGPEDSGKLLLVEYNRVVAHVAGADANGLADWPTDIAPRHHGLLNVLFTDAHVDTVRPEAIDPRQATLHDDFWRPERVAPLAPQ